MTVTQPTAHLLQGRTQRTLRYVPSHSTDIRRTIRRARLLAFLRRHHTGENK